MKNWIESKDKGRTQLKNRLIFNLENDIENISTRDVYQKLYNIQVAKLLLSNFGLSHK